MAVSISAARRGGGFTGPWTPPCRSTTPRFLSSSSSATSRLRRRKSVVFVRADPPSSLPNTEGLKDLEQIAQQQDLLGGQLKRRRAAEEKAARLATEVDDLQVALGVLEDENTR